MKSWETYRPHLGTASPYLPSRAAANLLSFAKTADGGSFFPLLEGLGWDNEITIKTNE